MRATSNANFHAADLSSGQSARVSCTTASGANAMTRSIHGARGSYASRRSSNLPVSASSCIALPFMENIARFLGRGLGNEELLGRDHADQDAARAPPFHGERDCDARLAMRP